MSESSALSLRALHYPSIHRISVSCVLKFSEQVQKNRENGPTYVVCHACVFEPGCLNYDREIEVEIERMLKSGHNVDACVRVFDALNLRSLFSDEWNIYEVFTFVAAMLMGAFEMFLLNFHVYTENFFTACVFTVISLLVWLPVAMMIAKFVFRHRQIHRLFSAESSFPFTILY
jgi:hypothetical protein